MADDQASQPLGLMPRLYFYQKNDKKTGFLSPLYASAFVDPDNCPGVRFQTLEHYIQYRKAKVCGENDQADAILNVPSSQPSRATRAGKQVASTEQWEGIKDEVVLWGTYLKFMAPGAGAIRRRLLGFKGSELVYADPTDSWLGIGTGAARAEYNRQDWGKNHLGTVLMLVLKKVEEAPQPMASSQAESASASSQEPAETGSSDDTPDGHARAAGSPCHGGGYASPGERHGAVPQLDGSSEGGGGIPSSSGPATVQGGEFISGQDGEEARPSGSVIPDSDGFGTPIRMQGGPGAYNTPAGISADEVVEETPQPKPKPKPKPKTKGNGRKRQSLAEPAIPAPSSRVTRRKTTSYAQFFVPPDTL